MLHVQTSVSSIGRSTLSIEMEESNRIQLLLTTPKLNDKNRPLIEANP